MLNTSKPRARTNSLSRKVQLLAVATVVAAASLIGFGAPANADMWGVEYFGGSPRPDTGMWLRGDADFNRNNATFSSTAVTFNDIPGDPYCTQLRAKAYSSSGSIDQWTLLTVCGGRSATYRNHQITAAPGYYLRKVEYWTVRVDGGMRSYLYTFTS